MTRDSDPLDRVTRDAIRMPNSNGLLRTGEVIDLLHARGIDITPGGWYWFMRDGRAPTGTRLSPYADRRWNRSDIERWEKPPRKPRKLSNVTQESRGRAAATRMGIDPDEYLKRREAGERWCARCKQWHDASVFRPDPQRSDGLAGACYRMKTRPEGPPQEELQARGRRSAAARIGIGLAEYERRRAAGELWCSPCRKWHPRSEFTPSRSGRLPSRCSTHRSRLTRDSDTSESMNA